MNKILEIASRKSHGGRRRIEIVLHEIPDDPKKVNRNGIHWSEENTLKNIETVKGIPICAEFLSDDKEIPLGHGFTATEKIDGLDTPVFENSEVCGYIDHGEIRDIEVNGNNIRALVGIGALYEQRYPKFVQWVRKNLETSSVDTSVEICGRPENENRIIYEAGECSAEYRCPKVYEYSGTAIISVLPADSNAIVLECAQANQAKEEETMTEQEIMEVVKTAISECNDTAAAHEAEVAELNTAMAEKEARISELEAKVSELEAAVAEKTSEIETLNSTISEQNEVIEANEKAQKISALEEVLSVYTEEEQKYAESEINSYKENPLEGDIDAIKSKIAVAIVEKQKAESRNSEQNTATETVESIFGEVNTFNEEDEEEVSIF